MRRHVHGLTATLVLGLALATTLSAAGREAREKNIPRPLLDDFRSPCKDVYVADVTGNGLSEFVSRSTGSFQVRSCEKEPRLLATGKAAGGTGFDELLVGRFVDPRKAWVLTREEPRFVKAPGMLVLREHRFEGSQTMTVAPENQCMLVKKPVKQGPWLKERQNLLVGDFDGNGRDELLVIDFEDRQKPATFYRKVPGRNWVQAENLTLNAMVPRGTTGTYYLTGNVIGDRTNTHKKEPARDEIIQVDTQKGVLHVYASRQSGPEGQKKYRYLFHRLKGSGRLPKGLVSFQQPCFAHYGKKIPWIVYTARIKPGPFEQIIAHDPETGAFQAFEVHALGLRPISVDYGQLAKQKGYLFWNKSSHSTPLHDCVSFYWDRKIEEKRKDPRVIDIFQAVYDKKRKHHRYQRAFRLPGIKVKARSFSWGHLKK